MTAGRWLAAAAGAALALLLGASFMLWGTQGPAILFDAFIAFCA